MVVCDTGGGLKSLFRPALVHFHWQLYLHAELFQDNKLQQPPFLLPRAWLHLPGCCMAWLSEHWRRGDSLPRFSTPWTGAGDLPGLCPRQSRTRLLHGLTVIEEGTQKTCRCHFRQVYVGNISLTKPVKHKPVSSLMKQINWIGWLWINLQPLKTSTQLSFAASIMHHQLILAHQYMAHVRFVPRLASFYCSIDTHKHSCHTCLRLSNG